MQTSQQTRTVDGIVFTRGENDCQSYWDTQNPDKYGQPSTTKTNYKIERLTQQGCPYLSNFLSGETEYRGVYYAVLQPKGMQHWAIIALDRTTSRLLNGAVRSENGQLHCDPLYSHHELTILRLVI